MVSTIRRIKMTTMQLHVLTKKHRIDSILADTLPYLRSPALVQNLVSERSKACFFRPLTRHSDILCPVDNCVNSLES